MSKLQVRTITLQIVTKGDVPLHIEDHAMQKIVDAVDHAVRDNVDMTYGRTIDGKRQDFEGDDGPRFVNPYRAATIEGN